jgi:hypothetical protein
LLSYGFEHARPEQPAAGSSRYTLRLPSETVHLWGFGIVYEESANGAIYLNRFSFRPVYSDRSFDAQAVWRPDEIGGFSVPESPDTIRATVVLTKALLLWIGAYEEHVLSRLGLCHRQATLWDWREPAILPGRMPAEWRSLAHRTSQVVEEQRLDTVYESATQR